MSRPIRPALTGTCPLGAVRAAFRKRQMSHVVPSVLTESDPAPDVRRWWREGPGAGPAADTRFWIRRDRGAAGTETLPFPSLFLFLCCAFLRLNK